MADANAESGKLKIGDHWNAISIIALSQNNPLKAIAEFVENSIDAGARNVSVVRGKDRGEQYLKVVDDGRGIDDFHYLATHIGDSVKRKLKKEGATGIQGEFGIGLLSFWTVGEACTIVSAGREGTARSMRLVKGNPAFSIKDAPALFARGGTELHIAPVLPGLRQLSGEKIQAYLASELRDRIAKSGVRIKIVDKSSRRELVVEPRKFRGRLIHALPEPRSPLGEVYCELYVTEPSSESAIGLYKGGTRVLPDISRLEAFSRSPWNSSMIEGIVDASFLQLTPGTRDGVVLDEAFESLTIALEPVEEALSALIEAQRKAEDEEASKAILHKVTKALKEAFLLLPSEEYGWLSAQTKISRPGSSGANPVGDGSGSESGSGSGGAPNSESPEKGDLVPGETGPDGPSRALGEDELADASYGTYMPDSAEPAEDRQRLFFDFPGPLFKVMISPASCVIGVGESKRLRAVARDKSRRAVDSDLSFEWRIEDGGGSLSGADSEFAEYSAADEPGVALIELRATQGETVCVAEALVTVTAELVPRGRGGGGASKRGLPGYTFQKAPGELWRSKYDQDRSLIVINKAHADFIYASRHAMTKLRYIARLFAKELVLANFPEATKDELLERMVELVLYTEENLK